MITQLRRNIFDVCEQVTNLSGKTFYKIAPEGTKYPYVVFFMVTGVVERDTGNEFEDVYVQFSFYDDMSHLTALEAIHEDFKNKFTVDKFNISSHRIVALQRQFYRDGEFDKVAQIITQYKFHLQKN